MYFQIWNHPDVLYNFLRKRSEVNAAIEEDLDLEEIGGVTKAGRARNGKATRRAPKTRVFTLTFIELIVSIKYEVYI